MGRAPYCEKMGLKKGPWTPAEDRVLIDYVRQHGHNNWRALPKQAGLLRCGKSCRLRWTNYLRPDIKRGNFTQEEEDTIINLHEMLGNRWSAIAARLPGRTDNEIKNVWHTHLKKKLNHSGNGSTTSTTTVAAAAEAVSADVVPMRKRVRKVKAAAAKKAPKHENSMEPIGCDEGTDNKNNTINNNSDNSNAMQMPMAVVKGEPVSPQPCTSEVSTLTSTSTSTGTSASVSDTDNCSKENVGGKTQDNHNNSDNLGDFPEINDDFWMEVLSVEDTAVSTEELPRGATTSEDVMLGTEYSKAHSEDMDVFWQNLMTNSHDFPELMEMMWKSDVVIS